MAQNTPTTIATTGYRSKPVTTNEKPETIEKLIEAAASGQTETVGQLLDAGADIHVANDAALHHATWGGHFETVSLALPPCGMRRITTVWRKESDKTQSVMESV
jgi:ankyrin repeat protein